jgi:hypothetical protein
MINFTPKRKVILGIIFTILIIIFTIRFGSGWNTLFSDPIAAIIVTIFGLIMLSLAVAIIGVFCVDKILLPIINLFIKKAPSANREQLESIIDDLFKRISKTHSVATKALLKNINELEPDKMGKFFGVLLYEAIYGYQVTCLVGFSLTEKLIKATDLLEFRKKVLEKIEIKTGLSIQQIEFNNEYFLDCAGDLECLNNKFLVRVVKLCKLDEKITGQNKAIKIFNKLSVSLAIQTQRNTARAFGNMRLVQELDQVIKNDKF